MKNNEQYKRLIRFVMVFVLFAILSGENIIMGICGFRMMLRVII